MSTVLISLLPFAINFHFTVEQSDSNNKVPVFEEKIGYFFVTIYCLKFHLDHLPGEDQFLHGGVARPVDVRRHEEAERPVVTRRAIRRRKYRVTGSIEKKSPKFP